MYTEALIRRQKLKNDNKWMCNFPLTQPLCYNNPDVSTALYVYAQPNSPKVLSVPVSSFCYVQVAGSLNPVAMVSSPSPPRSVISSVPGCMRQLSIFHHVPSLNTLKSMAVLLSVLEVKYISKPCDWIWKYKVHFFNLDLMYWRNLYEDVVGSRHMLKEDAWMMYILASLVHDNTF